MKKLSLNEYYEVPIYSAVIVVVINVAAMVVEFSNLVLFGAVMGDKFFCFALSMMFVGVSARILSLPRARRKHEVADRKQAARIG